MDRVGDDEPRLAHLQPVLDGLRAEGGEQRLVDRARAPDAQGGRQQFRPARQHDGDDVARPDAPAGQMIGEARGLLAQLGEGDFAARAVLTRPMQRDAAGLDPSVATFDAGVDPVGEGPVEPSFDVREAKGIIGGLIGGTGEHQFPRVLSALRAADPGQGASGQTVTRPPCPAQIVSGLQPGTQIALQHLAVGVARQGRGDAVERLGHLVIRKPARAEGL